MAFTPRPPLMQVPVSAMVGSPFTLTTNLVPSVRIPMTVAQTLSSIPTPMSRGSKRLNPPPLPAPPRPPVLTRPPSYSQRAESAGPNVTVFVGNITERAPDVMIRHILNACGPVLNWKRVQGASGKLQGFGFCDYANPDAALRAIRLLHNYDIATNKLVVKGDSKSNEVLNEYKEKRKKDQHQNGGDSPLQDERKIEEDEDDYIDDEMRAEDQQCLTLITSILSDHKKEINNYVAPHNRQDMREKRMTKVQEKLVALSSLSDLANIPSTLNLDDMEDVEEGKKEIISREITLFREQMKKQEEEKERERKQRDRERDRDRERNKERDREREHTREREREREHTRERERREREERRRKSRSVSRSGSTSRRSRSPSQEVRHSRKDKRHTSRSRSRSPTTRKSDKEILREKERDVEEKERKEQERKVRKKEMQYQERLRNWESREHKKQKELDRESDREKMRESDREREARRLKEFLEDYDDERDDPRYYKGHAFQRKLVERDHEKDLDTKDRIKEKEELEELRTRILQEEHENPDKVYELACAEREELYKPKLLLKTAERPVITIPCSPPPPPPEPEEPVPVVVEHEAPLVSDSSSDDDDRHSDAPPEQAADDQDESSLSRDIFSSEETTTPLVPKRKKLDVKDVFNQEDEDTPSKKKKLPLPGKDKSKEKGGEEKRKHIKSLIDKIPTSKEELFAFPIDSSLVDAVLMEKRIRPWINKKIIEYIGEPEPTLVDFICSKVLVGSEPQALLNDVQMVLDDEAEVFVVKMWRLLIYEIEAKKMGLGKS